MRDGGHRPLIYFWGGEPMLYDGLLDLIEGATALGLPVSIATNGFRVAAAARRFGSEPRTQRGWIGDWKPDDFELLNSQLAKLKNQSRSLKAPPVVILPALSGVENLKSYYTDHAATFGFNRCISIYQALEVNSNGNVSPCRDYHDYVVGNVKEKTITQIWNSAMYQDFRRSQDLKGLMPICSRCCGLMGF